MDTVPELDGYVPTVNQNVSGKAVTSYANGGGKKRKWVPHFLFRSNHCDLIFPPRSFHLIKIQEPSSWY